MEVGRDVERGDYINVALLRERDETCERAPRSARGPRDVLRQERGLSLANFFERRQRALEHLLFGAELQRDEVKIGDHRRQRIRELAAIPGDPCPAAVHRSEYRLPLRSHATRS